MVFSKLNTFAESLCIFHRSELVAQVSSVKESWFNTLALTDQCRSSIKEQLHLWRTYLRGLKLLWKLLGDVDPLLPPPGPAPCALLQLRSCMDDYQVSLQGLILAFSIATYFEVKGN